MDNQAYDTLTTLEGVTEVGVRPCERRGRFVSYIVYLRELYKASKIRFYVLVYEENETTYTVPNTRVPEIVSRGGLQALKTPMIIYSKKENDKILGKIDNIGVQNSQDPSKNMLFCVRNEKDLQKNAYRITLGSLGREASIMGLKSATGMKVRFDQQLDAFSKYFLILASIKTLYVEFRFQDTPMPTNLNISYGVDLPLLPPPPAVLISMTGLEFLRPLRKCFYRVVGKDPAGNHYSEIIDFDSHNLICVECSSKKQNLWLSHFSNAYGDASFYSSRVNDCSALEVVKMPFATIGSLQQHGTQIFDVRGVQIMAAVEANQSAAASSMTAARMYRIYQTHPNNRIIGEITLCEEIGQLVMECDICISVEHKALLLTCFSSLAVFAFQIRQKFVWPELEYYPFKSKISSSTTTVAPY